MEPLALHQACDFIKMFEFSIIKTSMCSELAVMMPAYEDIHLWLASVRAFRVLQVDVVSTLLLHPHWSCYAMTVTFHVVLYRWLMSPFWIAEDFPQRAVSVTSGCHPFSRITCTGSVAASPWSLQSLNVNSWIWMTDESGDDDTTFRNRNHHGTNMIYSRTLNL